MRPRSELGAELSAELWRHERYDADALERERFHAPVELARRLAELEALPDDERPGS